MKRRRLIAIVVGVTLVGWLVVAFILPHEPRYQGRSLSSWIKAADDSSASFQNQNPTNAEFQAAAHAVRSIGTNAIPTLLGWAATKDSRFRHRVLCWLHENTTVCDGLLDDGDKRFQAELGFRILGKSGSAASPALLQLARNGDTLVSINALFCLYFIDGDKETFLPVLVQTIHGTNSSARPRAAMMLMECYPEEAEKAGVYELFPGFRPRAAGRIAAGQPGPAR